MWFSLNLRYHVSLCPPRGHQLGRLPRTRLPARRQGAVWPGGAGDHVQDSKEQRLPRSELRERRRDRAEVRRRLRLPKHSEYGTKAAQGEIPLSLCRGLGLSRRLSEWEGAGAVSGR
ncbi:hypothetical protein GDO81_026011 [Engystomops pustulosus]|uniref:Uncharacterized protein n=1 Tax=Engystomops pustulosus TaxID=76066 RepID=A0AAV6ZM01_ENGPU|nr:hypothetical protein GDO81_026011 [Engystomops pustulosus]